MKNINILRQKPPDHLFFHRGEKSCYHPLTSGFCLQCECVESCRSRGRSSSSPQIGCDVNTTTGRTQERCCDVWCLSASWYLHIRLCQAAPTSFRRRRVKDILKSNPYTLILMSWPKCSSSLPATTETLAAALRGSILIRGFQDWLKSK